MYLEVNCKQATVTNAIKFGVKTIYTMGFNTKINRFSPPETKVTLQTDKQKNYLKKKNVSCDCLN